jgi:hypothetical protein
VVHCVEPLLLRLERLFFAPTGGRPVVSLASEVEGFLVLWGVSPCSEYGNILPACDPGKCFGGVSGLVGFACFGGSGAGPRDNYVLAGDGIADKV